MISCIDGDVCSRKKCNECLLDDCRNTLLVLEEAEKMWLLTHEEVIKKKIKRTYPECYECPFLERRGENNIYCFYRSKDECLLRRKENES